MSSGWNVTAILNLAPRWWQAGFRRLVLSGVGEREHWDWDQVALYLALSLGAYGQIFDVVLKDFEEEVNELRERVEKRAAALEVDVQVLSVITDDRWYPDWKAPSRAWLSRSQWASRNGHKE